MSRPATCILDPELRYAEFAGRLERLGWRERPRPAALPPLVAGEPEQVEWRHPVSGAELRYSFHPALGLRKVEATRRGTEAFRILVAELPALSEARILDGLRSDDERVLLRSVLAAAELELVAASQRVAALTSHPLPRVRSAAERAQARLSKLERGR